MDSQLDEIFLKRYKMSRDDLTRMAGKMGIALNNLCYLKQEFDLYDEDETPGTNSATLENTRVKVCMSGLCSGEGVAELVPPPVILVLSIWTSSESS